MQTVVENPVQTIPIVRRSENNGNGLPKPYRWTVSEYYEAGDAGLFRGKRVQLIDGEIIEMAPMGSPHAVAVRLIATALEEIFHTSTHVRSQLPLNFGELDEPEPDAAVVTGDVREYSTEHPHAALLIVEIADTSLNFDRGKKAALYAEFGIADYWIVNLRDRCVEVHRSPVNDADLGWVFTETRSFTEAESLSPMAKTDRFIAVADLLP